MTPDNELGAALWVAAALIGAGALGQHTMFEARSLIGWVMTQRLRYRTTVACGLVMAVATGCIVARYGPGDALRVLAIMRDHSPVGWAITIIGIAGLVSPATTVVALRSIRRKPSEAAKAVPGGYLRTADVRGGITDRVMRFVIRRDALGQIEGVWIDV